jgi:hypothetical protein
MGSIMSRWRLTLSSGLVLAGCQSTQLSYTTTNGASAVEPIYRQQAVDNLAKLIKEPYSLPSEVFIQNGTMQANESVTPTVTFPFSSMFAKTVSATPSSTNTIAGGGGSLAGTLGYQLNYVVQPMGDIVGLSNLRAIYMQVLCESAPELTGCVNFDIYQSYMPPRVYQPKWDTGTKKSEKAQLINRLVLDPYFLYRPLCILCLTDDASDRYRHDAFLIDSTDPTKFRQYLTISDTLNKRWLSWGSAPTANGAVSIGTSGGIHFFAPPGDFANFLLLTLPLPTSG